MMKTKATDSITTWWEIRAIKLQVFLQIMTEGQDIPSAETDKALRYFTIRTQELEQSHYPDSAEEIYIHLLEALQHMQQSLLYRKQRNEYQASLRVDMAYVSMSALRLRLIQAGILL